MRFTVDDNDRLTPDVFRMRLRGEVSPNTMPGQFVQVALPGFYLRRPISVCDWLPGPNGFLDLMYKAVGQGTRAMSRIRPGAELDLLTGLGNGFDVDRQEKVRCSLKPLLVGGGVGAPPLLGLYKRLAAVGKKPVVVLGFATGRDALLAREFAEAGAQVAVCTLDGSSGTKGLVTDGMKGLHDRYDYVFACGPQAMLRAVHTESQAAGVAGQYSFEERMGCGFGVCMGCSCETKYGNKRICKDGPVLLGEEIIW